MQTSDALVVHSESQPGPPMESIDITWHRFDVHRDIELGDLAELLDDDGGLESALLIKRDMLPVTSAASRRARPLAGRGDTVCRRSDDLHRIGPQVGRPLLGDLDPHLLARQRMTNEHGATVRCMCDADPTVADWPDVQDHLGFGGMGLTSSARRTSPAAGRARSTTRPDDAS
jgi:hypothetical protein